MPGLVLQCHLAVAHLKIHLIKGINQILRLPGAGMQEEFLLLSKCLGLECLGHRSNGSEYHLLKGDQHRNDIENKDQYDGTKQHILLLLYPVEILYGTAVLIFKRIVDTIKVFCNVIRQGDDMELHQGRVDTPLFGVVDLLHLKKSLIPDGKEFF